MEAMSDLWIEPARPGADKSSDAGEFSCRGRHGDRAACGLQETGSDRRVRRGGTRGVAAVVQVARGKGPRVSAQPDATEPDREDLRAAGGLSGRRIAGDFVTLGNVVVGLSPLSNAARGQRRVERWVTGKLIIDTLHALQQWGPAIA